MAAPEARRERTGALALLEVLRAPLLLSPVSDVVAGWSVASLATGRTGHGVPLVAAAACGTCLLAAGMAQNALADRADDAARKPDRPLPRGAVSARTVGVVFAALTVAALLFTAAAPGTTSTAVAIVVLTAAYHLLLKPVRVAGCLALGGLRGLDMALGAVAALGGVGPLLEVATPFAPLVACAGYALYVTGASLHASTDDGPGGEAWSAAGLLLASAALVGLAAIAGTSSAASVVTWPVFALALWRLVDGRRRLPPPALTGVALSNLVILGAGLCLGAGRVPEAALLLGLFLLSKRMLRVFPPS